MESRANASTSNRDYAQLMREAASAILWETRSEEHPCGIWGPTESEAAQAYARELADESLAAGEVGADMVGDLREHLYRQAMAEVERLHGEVL